MVTASCEHWFLFKILEGKKGPDDQEPSQNFLLGDCLFVFATRGQDGALCSGFSHAIAFSDQGGRNDFSFYYLSVDIDILQRATILLSMVSVYGVL
jgi:hypothetical protein